MIAMKSMKRAPYAGPMSSITLQLSYQLTPPVMLILRVRTAIGKEQKYSCKNSTFSKTLEELE